MSRIVPKLNLNKTPQLVENNSLVMAKNIRLLEDGTIGPDTSLEEVETKTGIETQVIVHHDAVTETITKYMYTVLNCNSAVAYIRDSTVPSTSNLENLAFDFEEYAPSSSADAQFDRTTTTNKYAQKDSNYYCTIYCYNVINGKLQLVEDKFIYDVNYNKLVNNNGLCLFLAVKKSSYDNDQSIFASTDYYYVILPSKYLGNTVVIEDINYTVINPVFPTNKTETVVVRETYDEIVSTYDTPKYIGQIVGFDNKVYFFKESLYVKPYPNLISVILARYPGETFVWITPTGGKEQTLDIDENGYLTRRGVLVEDSYLANIVNPYINDRIKIFEYDEVEKRFTIVNCGWKYSGGEINGCVFRNNTGITILTICEYNLPNNVYVPIKHINLHICSNTDDESIYTQNPNIPITNLNLSGEYSAVIPSGVYQFFIRYKINDNQYTSWFPCSKELYAGTRKKIATIQGELKYIDKHTDSDTSFIFEVEHLFSNYNNIYKKFQIGFILSKDDESIIAREWREFNFDTNTIYFDCFTTDIQEANIDDMLETTYEIFNVENCVNYKNKLYIANYKETDFNPDLNSLARNIQINIKTKSIGESLSGLFFDGDLLVSSSNNNNYDYIGNTNPSNHIKHKWALDNYFPNSGHNQEHSDVRGYFSSIPFICSEHNHVENSNVVNTDSTYGHTYVGEDGGVNGGWMNCTKLFKYNKACILALYIKDGNNWIDILGVDYRNTYNNGWQTTPFINNNKYYIDSCDNIESIIVNKADFYIRDKIAYFSTTNNKWYIKDSNNNIREISDYYIVYSVVKEKNRQHYKIDNPYDPEQLYEPFYYHGSYASYEFAFSPEFDLVTTEKTVYILKRTTVFDTSIITSSIQDDTEYPTLLPFTKYNFYIHYVKSNGVVTNGYLINDSPIYLDKYCLDNGSYSGTGNVKYYSRGNPITTVANDSIIIYPSFSNINRPDGYVGCFITAAKIGNNVCQLFNVDIPTTQVGGKYRYKADCIELDTLTYTKFDKLSILTSAGVKITNNGKYYDSGNTEDVNYFGECGSVVWDVDNIIETINNVSDNVFWIVMQTNESTKRIIKFTPFIRLQSTPVSYDNYNNINNIGFTCFIKKLKKNNLYISGSDVYTITKTDVVNSNATIDLIEDNNVQHFMLVRDNIDCRIKSNFNFNYLNLSKDVTAIPKTIHPTENTSQTLLVCTVDSLTSSYIYEFNNWYKTYTRKQYSVKEDNKRTEFNNTLRCSRVIGDEDYNTFKFDSTDYYNVPTLRGIITNLISIANTIYVHCEHSLFKFTDNKTINVQEEEVTLQENDIFNSGISEVFDAQYGYAGLSNREQSLVTYNAYVFYDSVAKVIYAYGGEQQIGSISEPIKKLIEAINPTDVRFVGDELHNRFFVNLIAKTGNVCLSFNFNAKSFISIHDIDFKFGFHTRKHTYFIHDNIYEGNIIGWSIYNIVDVLKVRSDGAISPVSPGQDDRSIPTTSIYDYHYVAYQNCYKRSLINITDCDNDILNQYCDANSCVDIIVNTEYETIKSLEYVKWICSRITNYGNNYNLVAEEVLNRLYPCTKLRIYSDSTMTDLIELLNANGVAKISNGERNIDSYGNSTANPKSWQYPQYNCGIWSMNYFRDILNTGDIFYYKDPTNKITGGVGHSETTDLTPKEPRLNLTQENSLLYGKYFVVRFIFNNKNFKLENLILRMNDYGKTK